MPEARFRPLRTVFRKYTLAATLLPCVLMAGFLSYFLLNRLESSSMGEVDRILALQRQFLNTWIGDRQRDLLRLAAIEELRGGNLADVETAFRRFLQVMPEFRGAGFIDAEGYTRVDSMTRTGVYVGDRPYFQAATRGETYTSDMLVGRATGSRVIIVCAPVQDGKGHFAGAVFASLSLDLINATVAETRLQFGGGLMLLDRQGRVLAGSCPGKSGQGEQHVQAAGEMPSDGREFDFACSSGATLVAVARQLETTGWTLVGAVPRGGVRAAVLPVVWVVFGAGVVSFLLIGPVALRLSRRMADMIATLAGSAARLAQGDYAQPLPNLETANPPAEFRVLADAYESMRGRIMRDMQALETIARTDELTGLPNRRWLMEEGRRMIQISARAGQPCSCLLVDVDHFKAVNDTFGHAKGDAVLQQLAEVLHNSMREADLLGRLGGEEFLVICAHTGHAEAMTLATRLCESVHRTSSGVLAELGLTVSVGVATLERYLDDGATLFEALISTADRAMYQAKGAGRDRVVAMVCNAGTSSCQLVED